LVIPVLVLGIGERLVPGSEPALLAGDQHGVDLGVAVGGLQDPGIGLAQRRVGRLQALAIADRVLDGGRGLAAVDGIGGRGEGGQRGGGKQQRFQRHGWGLGSAGGRGRGNLS
jgi:hypothetical protein